MNQFYFNQISVYLSLIQSKPDAISNCVKKLFKIRNHIVLGHLTQWTDSDLINLKCTHLRSLSLSVIQDMAFHSPMPLLISNSTSFLAFKGVI